MSIKKIFLSALVAAGALSAQCQTNSYPIFSSGGTSGGGGDYTNVTGAQLKLQATSSFIRIPHISADASASTVYNYESGKNVFWGEPTDGGTYFFRGRNLTVTEGRQGIGTTSPQSLLHINSTVDPRATFRLYWNSDVSKYFSFWQGITGAVIDPIGTGRVVLGYDQSTDVIMGLSGTGVVQGRVGIGILSPSAKVHINGSGGTNTDLLVTGRITTGDAANAGGVYVNSAATMFVGQLNSTTMGMYNNGSWRMVVDNTGKIGIGTTQPDYPLTVNGSIHAKEVRVDLNVPAPDYVFEKDYQLTSLEDIKNYIDQNKHLPEVPSAKEMEKNGVQLGEMNMILLKKIEELTLLMIEQNKKINELRKDNDAQNKMIDELKKNK